MTDSSPTPAPVLPTSSDYELTLGQINGIFASRVVLDANRALTEIHIVASTARKPKQIVRDIETMFFVKHRVKVDYRKISMVQLADERRLRVPLTRPEIRRVIEDEMGNQKRIRVEIQGAGKFAIGEAKERLDNPSPFLTAANATIDGIEKLVGRRIDFRLESAAVFRLEMREVLIVIVTLTAEGGEETFVGASFVGSRPADSAARATLDAVNRRIHALTS